LAIAGFGPAAAQSVCVTPNCVFGDVPAVCRAMASPRTTTVQMGSGVNLIFVPANPKIEPGDCILWRSASNTHSSSGNSCTDDLTCGSIAPPACQFETGNVDAFSDTPTSTCHYDSAAFPAGTGQGYYCRIHASPSAGTMRGTLRVTTDIKLTVDKDLGTNSVKLSWTGGGVVGDLSYKVARGSGGDPTFPLGSTNTANPDGGVLGTTFTDAGELASPTTRYYLVRNKQTNEP
jgi:plastocyanin